MRTKLMELVYAARVHADEECDKQEECSRCPYDAQADMCQNGPIVDHLLANGVVVREKGEWIGEGDGYADGEIVYDVWYCSECNHCIDDGTDDPSLLPNFCPNCGADMRKGENDG